MLVVEKVDLLAAQTAEMKAVVLVAWLEVKRAGLMASRMVALMVELLAVSRAV